MPFDGTAEVAVLHSEVDGMLIYRSIKVKDVKPGSYLFAGSKSQFSRVKYVIKQTGSTMLCRDLETKTLVSPWHPVFIDNKWQFPIELENLYSKPEQHNTTIYNFILAHHHIIGVSGKQYVTYGHNIKEPCVKHDYFGTNLVINDLIKLSDENNIIDITTHQFVRDAESLTVCGIE